MKDISSPGILVSHIRLRSQDQLHQIFAILYSHELQCRSSPHRVRPVYVQAIEAQNSLDDPFHSPLQCQCKCPMQPRVAFRPPKQHPGFPGVEADAKPELTDDLCRRRCKARPRGTAISAESARVFQQRPPRSGGDGHGSTASFRIRERPPVPSGLQSDHIPPMSDRPARLCSAIKEVDCSFCNRSVTAERVFLPDLDHKVGGYWT
mmetsp:Transcript_24044/g.58165  ORF Transcript_24044/g.58165 Transcript_24044/m.58165 type:complete len:206 (+) Transcript_24044:2052-2669(+)